MRQRVNFKSQQEWLEARKHGIGASEAGTILGLNPWETPYQLWRRKVGIDPEKPVNFAMTAGHYLEDAVSLFYRDATGKEIIQASKGDWMFRNDKYPFLQVSPDRTYWIPGAKKNDDNKGILECKTTQLDVDAENIPHSWFCQLQMNLGVAEYEQGAVAWLTQGRNFGYKEFEFDPEFFEYLKEEVTRFWVDNIKGMKEPDLQTVDDVLLRNPRHTPDKLIVADEELIEACRELKELKESLSTLDDRKKELEATIKLAMGDAEALVADITGGKKQTILATWKAAKDSLKFNEKKFAEAHADIYETFKETIPGSRRFLLK